jgi:hypothetical protein
MNDRELATVLVALRYPSVLRVVRKLEVDYDRFAGESVSLHTVEEGEPDLVLRATDVGSREPEFLDTSA